MKKLVLEYLNNLIARIDIANDSMLSSMHMELRFFCEAHSLPTLQPKEIIEEIENGTVQVLETKVPEPIEIKTIEPKILEPEPECFILRIREFHGGLEVSIPYTGRLLNGEILSDRILTEFKIWRGDDESEHPDIKEGDRIDSGGVEWEIEDYKIIPKEDYDILNKYNI